MIVTEKQINQESTRVGVLNLVSDACRYYGYTVGDNFELSAEIQAISEIKENNNVELDLILNVFKAAYSKLEKINKKEVKNA